MMLIFVRKQYTVQMAQEKFQACEMLQHGIFANLLLLTYFQKKI